MTTENKTNIPSVAVVGGVNMDIGGQSFQPLILSD